MSRSVNKVILVGNVGGDPEVRSIASGSRVANLTLATGRQWKDKNGVQQEKTEWHRLQIWEKLADVAEKYVKKGDRIYVEGELEYRSYEDKDGVTKYMTEIRVRELVMLGGKDGQTREPATAAAPAASYSDPAPAFPEDDDLPF